ncbi:MAG: type II toxin-antitoxin system RelE/ParE family toxin [Verrucomicrobiota bacterium]
MFREILFYESPEGRKPIQRFLDKLDGKQAKKVAWTLQLVEEQKIVPSKYFKKMTSTKDLWEVRVASGSNIFRLLGFFDGVKLVVISHAFQKKTQKIPKQAIEIAEERKKDYFRRKK